MRSELIVCRHAYLSVDPLALKGTEGIGQHALAMAQPELPSANVLLRAVAVGEDALAVHLVVEPRARVRAAVRPAVVSTTLLHAFDPFAIVARAIDVAPHAPAMVLVGLPVASVRGAVGVRQRAVAVLTIAVPVPVVAATKGVRELAIAVFLMRAKRSVCQQRQPLQRLQR